MRISQSHPPYDDITDLTVLRDDDSQTRPLRSMMRSRKHRGQAATERSRQGRPPQAQRARARACLGGEAREARTWGASLFDLRRGRDLLALSIEGMPQIEVVRSEGMCIRRAMVRELLAVNAALVRLACTPRIARRPECCVLARHHTAMDVCRPLAPLVQGAVARRRRSRIAAHASSSGARAITMTSHPASSSRCSAA